MSALDARESGLGRHDGPVVLLEGPAEPVPAGALGHAQAGGRPGQVQLLRHRHEGSQRRTGWWPTIAHTGGERNASWLCFSIEGRRVFQ